MAYAFDTWAILNGYGTRGLAKSSPEAAREFVMGDLVTKADLPAAMDTLSLRLTLGIGVMLTTSLATLAAIIKL